MNDSYLTITGITGIDRRPSATVIRHTAPLSITKRLHYQEKEAVADCIKEYGNRIWAFSTRHTRSLAEAQILSQEIFNDIWNYASLDGWSGLTPEYLLIDKLAMRRLIRHKWRRILRF